MWMVWHRLLVFCAISETSEGESVAADVSAKIDEEDDKTGQQMA